MNSLLIVDVLNKLN